MRGRVGCGVVVIAALLYLGIFLVWVVQHRTNQDRVYCANNLRLLAAFASPPKQPGEKSEAPLSVPPGTVPNPFLPPDRRLSWVVYTLPTMDSKQNMTEEIMGGLDQMRAWNEGANTAISQKSLPGLLCYANPAMTEPGAPGKTQYVGNGGLGSDAPTLMPVPFPLAAGAPLVIPDRAGPFRYAGATPFTQIKDGLSETILFAEISTEVGPWLQGGPSTIRTLDPKVTSKPIGPGQPYGGNHPQGANFAFADSSVRFLTERTDVEVLRRLLTIAGDSSIGPVD